MWQFAYPWLFALLPLPLLAHRFLPPFRESQAALSVPFLERLAHATGQDVRSGAPVTTVRPWLGRVALGGAWVCVVCALARPQKFEDPIVQTRPVRDVLVAVDLSSSMGTVDMKDEAGAPVDRLTAVKGVLGDFLARRLGDRVGLVFFGNAPFVQVPFTEDLQVCRELMDEAQVGMAGPRTMLGDALGKAVSVFDESRLPEKVLILLTDGNDTGSLVPPVKAAQIAHDHGIVIDPIALGDPTTVGEERFDEATLQAVAANTGGRYFRAVDRTALAEVCRELDRLTQRKVSSVSYRPVTDLFPYPLAAGLVWSVFAQATLAWPRPRRTGQYPETGRSTSRFVRSGTRLTGWATVTAATLGPHGFHWLRPGFFWLLIPAALVFWATTRPVNPTAVWDPWMDRALLDALTVHEGRPNRFRPPHLLGMLWLASVVALAGPAWRPEKTPFAKEGAALVIVLKVTPSMEATDVSPSRLRRSVQKVSDLLTARAKSRNALVAYAGSAHLVMPLTTDPDAIRTFASALQPGLMPESGDAPERALALAQRQLNGTPGAILFLADGMGEGALGAFAEQRRKGLAPVHALAVTGAAAGASANGRAVQVLEQAAKQAGGSFATVTPDARDVQGIVRRVQQTAVAADVAEGKAPRWRDEGYALVPLLAAALLLWFRKGWVTAVRSGGFA